MTPRTDALRNPRSDDWDPDLADALDEPDFSQAPDPTDLDHPFADVDYDADEPSPIQQALRGDAAFWGVYGVTD